jgi:hypothetical protein
MPFTKYFILFLIISLASIIVIEVPLCRSEPSSDAVEIEFDNSSKEIRPFPETTVIYNGSAWISNASEESNSTTTFLTLSLQTPVPWEYQIYPKSFKLSEVPTFFRISLRLPATAAEGTHVIQILGQIITNQSDHIEPMGRSIYLNILPRRIIEIVAIYSKNTVMEPHANVVYAVVLHNRGNTIEHIHIEVSINKTKNIIKSDVYQYDDIIDEEHPWELGPKEVIRLLIFIWSTSDTTGRYTAQFKVLDDEGDLLREKEIRIIIEEEDDNNVLFFYGAISLMAIPIIVFFIYRLHRSIRQE